LIGLYYGHPEIVGLCGIAGMSMFIDGTNTARWILLSRARRLEISMVVLSGAALVGLLATIWLAMTMQNVWALAWGMLASSVVQKIGLFFFVRMRPALSLEFPRIRRFFGFGIGSMVNGLAFHLTQNIQTMVMGRYASATEVGLYNRGQTLFQLPVHQLTTGFGGALYLNMCRVQSDREAVLQLVLRGCWMLGLLLYPFATIVVSFGDWIVAWLLGPAWHNAGQVTRILGAGSMLGLTLVVVFRANNAIGRPARGAMVSLWSVPVFVIGVAMVGHKGAIAVAWWYAIYRTVLNIPATWAYFQGSGFRFKRFASSYAALLALAAVFLVGLLVIRELAESRGDLFRVTMVTVGGITTFAGTFFLYRFHTDGRQVLRWIKLNFGERFGLPSFLFGSAQG
jgi:O-antigen/teichoic acid export membrane protein